jgi:hypothetical protein
MIRTLCILLHGFYDDFPDRLHHFIHVLADIMANPISTLFKFWYMSYTLFFSYVYDFYTSPEWLLVQRILVFDYPSFVEILYCLQLIDNCCIWCLDQLYIFPPPVGHYDERADNDNNTYQEEASIDTSKCTQEKLTNGSNDNTQKEASNTADDNTDSNNITERENDRWYNDSQESGVETSSSAENCNGINDTLDNGNTEKEEESDSNCHTAEDDEDSDGTKTNNNDSDDFSLLNSNGDTTAGSSVSPFSIVEELIAELFPQESLKTNNSGRNKKRKSSKNISYSSISIIVK